MPLDLNNFQDPNLSEEFLLHLLDRQAPETHRRHALLWDYYRNPSRPASGPAADALNTNSRPYFQAQEAGLPARITGISRLGSAQKLTDLQRKEVVVENDIAWRINTMVDFLFGRPVRLRPLAADPQAAAAVQAVADALLEANGGLELLQEMALLGSIHGFVDVAFRFPAGDTSCDQPPQVTSQPSPAAGDADGHAPAHRPGRRQAATARAVAFARSIRLEVIEPARVLPILHEDDYRTVRYWVQRYVKHPPRLDTCRRRWWKPGGETAPAQVEVVEICGPHWWQRYENRRLAAEGANLLGRPAVVHVPNLPVPGCYSGAGDVEPLIPLQDELNTRLSDRANRVTYQSFRMYLGKCIDDFVERPVGPGQMWATDNPDASIEEFGADAGSPSENVHIEQVRSALDKVSGVTPVAAGLLRGNVGHLTSATALRVVLSGLLARTAKKRLAYGRGLRNIVATALELMDRAGVLHTRPEDRRVEVHWPDMLPTDEGEQLRNARVKAALGVPAERLLAELGYENIHTKENHTDVE